MDEIEVDRLLAAMTSADRRVYRALRQARCTDADLRVALKAHTTGASLRRLLDKGLVRHVGRTRQRRMMQYEATPVAEVETQAKKYAIRKPPGKRTRTGVSAKLAELRAMEPGNYPLWHENRKYVLQHTKVLTRIEPQMFWEAAPPDEIEMVREEVEELVEWAQRVLDAAAVRVDHEEKKATIHKLRQTNGRTPHEIENAERLAERLSEKLI